MSASAGCAEVGTLLQPLVDGDLSAAERATVESHLAECPSCTAEGARLRDNAAYLQEILSPLRMPADFGADFLFRLPKKDPRKRSAPAPSGAPKSIVMGDTRARRGSPLVAIGVVVFLAAAGGLGWLFLRPPAQVVRKDLMTLPDVKERPPKGQGDAEFWKAKIATTRFYADHVLSRANGLRHRIVAGAPGVLALADTQF